MLSDAMISVNGIWFVFVFAILSLHNLAQAVETGQFSRLPYHRILNIISQHTTGNALKCCDTCLAHEECQSVNYNPDTGSCQLVSQPIWTVSLQSMSDSSWHIYSKKEWFLVFVGLAGNGVDVHASYISGTGAVTDDVNCVTLNMAACQQNYRSPVMDSWSSLPVSEVKYSLYKNDQEVAYAIFNGAGSDVINWFSQTRLTESSWTEALTTPSFVHFSIEGHSPTRRFAIIANYNSCPGDLFFTVTITGPNYSCDFDHPLTFPQFIYSSATSPSYFQSGFNTEHADYMVVYIR